MFVDRQNILRVPKIRFVATRLSSKKVGFCESFVMVIFILHAETIKLINKRQKFRKKETFLTWLCVSPSDRASDAFCTVNQCSISQIRFVGSIWKLRSYWARWVDLIPLPCCPEITVLLVCDNIFFKITVRNIILLRKAAPGTCCTIANRHRTRPATSGHPRPDFPKNSIFQSTLFRWCTFSIKFTIVNAFLFCSFSRWIIWILKDFKMDSRTPH